MQLIKLYFLPSLLAVNCYLQKLWVCNQMANYYSLLKLLCCNASSGPSADSNIWKHIVSSPVSPNVALTFVIPLWFLIKGSSFLIPLTGIYHFNNALYVCPRTFIIVSLMLLFSNKMVTRTAPLWLFYSVQLHSLFVNHSFLLCAIILPGTHMWRDLSSVTWWAFLPFETLYHSLSLHFCC